MCMLLCHLIDLIVTCPVNQQNLLARNRSLQRPYLQFRLPVHPPRAGMAPNIC